MPEILKRALPTTVERENKGTLVCRYAPFGITAVAIDLLPDGQMDRYHEQFSDTIFDRQLNAATKGDGVFQRITLMDEHTSDTGMKIGFTTMLRKESDGIYGVTRLLPSKVDDVEALLDEGVDKLSVEFTPFRGGTKLMRDGVRLRTDAHLHRVALVAQGAYEGSEVLAMREAEEMVTQVDAEYQSQMDDLDSWLAEAAARQAELSARLTA